MDAGRTADLPHDIDAEQALLGALLAHPELFGIVAGRLAPEHFWEPRHGAVFGIARDLQAEDRTPSPVAIETRLPGDIGLGDLSLSQHLARAAKLGIRTNGAIDYAKRVSALWADRRIIGLGEHLAASAHMPGADPRAMLAEAMTELDEIRAAVDVRRTTARWAGDFGKTRLPHTIAGPCHRRPYRSKTPPVD
ncbi:DnaB-like helicase N-terminal domain-containing protein [Ancylobacter terrae]|uniref:DnaB-like helicase N-terminal domain-containing protein n=1 Tax=Ancylobacter sp. sgz301288 TaxID=3342077 RepID=UPI00385DE1A5